MAREQETPAKPSLIQRVFGNSIAQAVGILGVAFSLFQGLEPFLKFSRLMSYLVNHWRELTRGLWTWLASFVHLELPPIAMDVLTAAVLIMLFTVRSLRHSSITKIQQGRPLLFYTPDSLDGIFDYMGKYANIRFLRWLVLTVCSWIILTLAYSAVFIMLFLIFYMHVATLAWPVVFIGLGTFLYMYIVPRMTNYDIRILRSFAINSERVILVFILVLFINYIALHSHTINDFIQKAAG
jgi:hypothetical protein